ncbi:hypothetical protein M8J75_000247 [Diaphorina citri]|nr:hypothetical protein M8J75_000247 [Diaphorina citri]
MSSFLVVCLVVGVAQLGYVATQGDDCRWTGCEQNDWATKGCEHLGMQEKEDRRTPCDGGNKYLCCPRKEEEKSKCWWTSCQHDDWIITGCEQYERVETNKKTCKDTNYHKYQCCPQGVQPDDKPAAEPTTLAVPPGCRWTGCEHNDWAQKGCEHLGMQEKEDRRTPCDGGNKYLCCPRKEEEKSQCWWTSCQHDDWIITGCEQYQRVEVNKEECDGAVAAHRYQCCPEGVRPLEEVYSNCIWSPCQMGNESSRGCPSESRQIGREKCYEPGEEGGEIFHCCFKADENQVDADDIEFTSGETFVDFVKYLLFKSRNFTIEPDRLPCTMIDPEKAGILQVEEDGLRICDLCPNFPQKRLTNILLDKQPKLVEYNKVFGECYTICLDLKDCMAFSYDHTYSTCYLYDSTVANLRAEPAWTSVFMSQPTGVLEDWSYVRHTSVMGRPTASSGEPDFITCLDKCDRSPQCNIVSYNLLDKKCDMFSSSNEIQYIDLNYGFIAAFNVRNFPLGDDQFWRFAEDGNILEETKLLVNRDSCGKSNYNRTHSAYYSKPCLTNPSRGCDSASGCRHCYYPEEVDHPVDLPICPDSDFNRKEEIVKKLDVEMMDCLKNDKCMGVGFDKSRNSYDEITIQTLGKDYDASYMLVYPKLESGIHRHLDKIEFLANLRISRQGSSGNYQILKNVQSYEDCLNKLKEDKAFSKASYSFKNKECHLGDNKIEFKRDSNNQFITMFKKPELNSPLRNFVRVPNANVDTGKAYLKHTECKEHCEVECAKKCDSKCAYVLIKYFTDKTECYFYEDNDDLTPTLADNTLALVKISNLDFTIGSLDLLTPFQRHHIFECFADNNEQTQTSLSTYDTETNEISTSRRKRGFFDFLKKAFKKVGDFVGGVVKDTVKTVVKTVGGVAKTIGKAVTGDLKGAKKEFMDIPVVKDVKNVVDLGKAVVTGDWKKAKEKGADLLTSGTLDLVTTVIPGGKIVGTAAKAVGKGLKGAATATKQAGNTVKREVNKGISKVENKKKEIKDKKRDKDDKKKDEPDKKKEEDRSDCKKKRTKRGGVSTKNKTPAGPSGTKRKKPCDDDYCPKPNWANLIDETVEDCKKVKEGERCDYECEPSYREVDPRITCKKERNTLVWPNDGRCVLETCSGNPSLVSMETPQVGSLYRPGFGKYITAYIVYFDKTKKLPLWSMSYLQAEIKKYGFGKYKSMSYNQFKDYERSGSFYQHECTHLVGHQGKDADYLATGYDRGHLTPANVALWSPKARKAVNMHINVAPQDASTNRGPWSQLERHTECNSKDRATLVVTGVSLNGVNLRSHGTTGLLVPKYYWKMLCYKDERGREQVVGFISENSLLPNSKPQLKARRDELYKPRSQQEVLNIMTSGSGNPWLLSASKIFQGREVFVAGNALASGSSSSNAGAAVWAPVNAAVCALRLQLDENEKLGWNTTFSRKKRTKKQKQKYPQGNPADGDVLLRGCYDEDDDMFIDPDAEDFSDSDSDSDVDMTDVKGKGPLSAMMKEKADGVSMVSNIAGCNKRIVGYYTSWGNKTIFPAHLKRLTHVIYAFLEMSGDGSVSIGSADRATSKDPEKEKEKTLERLEGLMRLAKKFPHLKVMFAVGGWANSQYFSATAASPDKRIRFIASVIKLIEQYGFDGVDVDWEYPVTGGANEGVPADKQNYVTFMSELRTALDGLASRAGRKDKYLISFASAAGQWTLDPGYDLVGLLKYADFANIMTYDFFGAWESKWGAYTGPPAPLFFGMPPRFSGKTNVDWTIKYYACKSKTPHKINMGVPFYGRYWKNVGDPVDKSDNMWRMAAAVNGKFEGGYVPWNEINSFMSNGFEKHFHEKSKSPYAFNPGTKTFLGYENVQSLTHKKNYAAEKNVGGLMIWALEQDDDDLSLLNVISSANLCAKTDPNLVNFKCSPIDEKRWWTSEDGDDKAGLCGRSAPLYKGYYPVCDPDDPGYSCCGAFGYCGTGEKYCKCPTCTDYQNNPEKITKAPIKPTVPVQWYFLNDADGKRGRCGKTIPKINGQYPTCNPDDDNAYCCSNGGYCGATPMHCDCPDCVNFRKKPNHKF